MAPSDRSFSPGTSLLQELERLGVHYYTKARITQDLVGAMALHRTWRTLDADAFDSPAWQCAAITFQRGEWRDAKLAVRVLAIRSRERDDGKQVYLWENLEYSTQAWLTNDWLSTHEEVAAIYDARAGIEPVIGELRSAWSVGKAPSSFFDAGSGCSRCRSRGGDGWRTTESCSGR
jgi:hypothetical protein